MAFKLIGDGSLWSSVAITTYNLTNQFPAIPDPFTASPRDYVIETEAGYTHGYNMGTIRRRFPISLRLLTFADYRLLMTLFEAIGNRHWVTWEQWTGTVTTGNTTTIAETTVAMNTQQQTTNWFKDQIAIIKTTTDTNAPQGEKRRVSTYSYSATTATFTVGTAFSASVDTNDTYLVGFPVRLVGDVSKETPDGTLYNVDFVFEEVLLDGTG
ncbi:MAG: hypothetical protein ABT940_14440 [Alphaproteobacteria bacterium]